MKLGFSGRVATLCLGLTGVLLGSQRVLGAEDITSQAPVESASAAAQRLLAEYWLPREQPVSYTHLTLPTIYSV